MEMLKKPMAPLARCIVAAVLMAGCVGITDRHDFASPDTDHILSIFTVHAGAMGGFTTVATLRNADDGFSRLKGEIFAIRGEYAIQVSWTSNSAVRISCGDCEPNRVEKRADRWQGISIIYDWGKVTPH